eukprot:CAMPEP_0184658330 /NCGR_PEP_ID=MMETSP0308-20130426/24995_1 /TAXON_ID=38269 /ORGANISM="Gloeochaete witrockiana, Strain SAG 46.84" /LENGTH=103 /DNA_ID=CAMNT_0027097249 /DNA_START=231 /DNA_END=542 /DNA_ORIENTATION=-
MTACFEPAVGTCVRRSALDSSVIASPSPLTFHSMEEAILDIQLALFEDDMSLDEEIVEFLTSACPSPDRRISENPVAKTISMLDADFSECRRSPHLFRPISIC